MKGLVTLLACLALCSCGEKSQTAEQNRSFREPPDRMYITVDSVKSHKDPKAGWFGPSLWDIYPKGEDTAEVFCGSGPHISTGKEITLFFLDKQGTAESSSCRQIIAVAPGEESWDIRAGKPITEKELKAMVEGEDHLVAQWLDDFNRGLPPSWRNIRPIGPPCTDTSGSPDAVRNRYKNQKCSIAVRYPDYPSKPSILFLNWIVTGPPEITSGTDYSSLVAPDDVLAHIRSSVGANYVVIRSYYHLSSPPPTFPALPPVLQGKITVVQAEFIPRQSIDAGGESTPWGTLMADGVFFNRWVMVNRGSKLSQFSLADWLASQNKNVTTFAYGFDQTQMLPFERMTPQQQAVVQDFCMQGLQIYGLPNAVSYTEYRESRPSFVRVFVPICRPGP